MAILSTLVPIIVTSDALLLVLNPVRVMFAESFNDAGRLKSDGNVMFSDVMFAQKSSLALSEKLRYVCAPAMVVLLP